ncbi:MAG: hypothetical protein ACRC62_10985 [Microcoleus sp.]
MSHRGVAPTQGTRILTSVKPAVECRRIDRLKQFAYDRGFTNDEAKAFGWLSKTSTWEDFLRSKELLDLADIELEIEADDTDESLDTAVYADVFPVVGYSITRADCSTFSFFEWVDFSQLIALAFASIGISVLILGLWQQINPFNLFPIRINIQIEAKQ